MNQPGVFHFHMRIEVVMPELYFFTLGLVNSIMLIGIFLIRRRRLPLLRRFGWVYLLLAVPAVFGIYMARYEHQPVQYSIFLGIFLGFLLMEGLLDHVFKIDFRADWKKNWQWTVPYLALYYAMNYGFIVMPWKNSLTRGLVMLGLFAVQITANIGSHPRMKKEAEPQQHCGESNKAGKGQGD
jgi:hypothetical protein